MSDKYRREEIQLLEFIPVTITMSAYLIIQIVTKCPITFFAPKANVSVNPKLENAVSQEVNVQDLHSLARNHLQTGERIRIPNDRTASKQEEGGEFHRLQIRLHLSSKNVFKKLKRTCEVSNASRRTNLLNRLGLQAAPLPYHLWTCRRGLPWYHPNGCGQ